MTAILTVKRRCTEPGCMTLLCKANPGPKCWLHSPPQRVSKDDLIDLLVELMNNEVAA